MLLRVILVCLTLLCFLPAQGRSETDAGTSSDDDSVMKHITRLCNEELVVDNKLAAEFTSGTKSSLCMLTGQDYHLEIVLNINSVKRDDLKPLLRKRAAILPRRSYDSSVVIEAYRVPSGVLELFWKRKSPKNLLVICLYPSDRKYPPKIIKRFRGQPQGCVIEPPYKIQKKTRRTKIPKIYNEGDRIH